MITNLLGLPKQLEVLTIIVIGIVALLLDSSLFHVKSDVTEIWSYDYGQKLQDNGFETYLKYILSGVVFIRSFTVHAFLALYIVMLWPAVFVERPNLMIPWLMIGLVRMVMVNFITLLTGLYVCAIEKSGYHPICFDFILSQTIQHGPSVYAWFSLFNFYHDVKIISEENDTRRQLIEELMARRKRVKSLTLSNFDDKVDDGRNLISESTIDNLIHCLQSDASLSSSRSLDTLLSLLSNEQAKDEIMSIESLSEDQFRSISERAMETLNINEEEITRVKLEKEKDVSLKLSKCDLDAIPSTEEIQKQDTDAPTNKSEVINVENGPQAEPIPVESSAKPKCYCKYSSNRPQDEVELRCISLDKNFSKVVLELQNKNLLNVKDNQLATKKNVLENSERVDEIKNLEDKNADLQTGINFECQVNTLSRLLLEQPPEEVTRRFQFAKKIIFDQFG